MAKTTRPQKTKKKPSRKRETKSRDELKKMDSERGVGSSEPSSADNDPSWYANNEYLLNDAASLAYSNPSGVPLSWRAAKIMAAGVAPRRFSFPGIWTIEIAPSVGCPQTAADAVNVAARNIYSYVRHANSGHSNYDAPNMMLYLLAMDSLYSAYSWMARAYGLIRTFSQKNRYVPIPLFSAMGLDYNDFLENQVSFRFWLNTIAERIGSLCVPASMTYMLRHMWLFQNVFVDNMGLKAQMYVYNPAYFLQYETLCEGFVDAPGLKNVLPIDPSGTALKFSDVRVVIDQMIENVMRSEDLNIMSGDILKAFGEGSVWKLVPIHEDYDITAVYSDEVLHQIHNVTALGKQNYYETGNSRYKVYEHVDAENAISYIKETPFFATNFSPLGLILDVHTDQPNPGLTMVATRLMCGIEDFQTDSAATLQNREITICGSDVATRMFITNANADGGNALVWDGSYETVEISTYNQIPATWTESIYTKFLRQTSMLTHFTMHPTVYFYKVSSSGQSPVVYGVDLQYVYADIDNFTLLTNEELRKMHETALLSEFNVPLMGSWAHKLY